jgi:hypothetical protein
MAFYFPPQLLSVKDYFKSIPVTDIVLRCQGEKIDIGLPKGGDPTKISPLWFFSCPAIMRYGFDPTKRAFLNSSWTVKKGDEKWGLSTVPPMFSPTVPESISQKDEELFAEQGEAFMDWLQTLDVAIDNFLWDNPLILSKHKEQLKANAKNPRHMWMSTFTRPFKQDSEFQISATKNQYTKTDDTQIIAKELKMFDSSKKPLEESQRILEPGDMVVIKYLVTCFAMNVGGVARYGWKLIFDDIYLLHRNFTKFSGQPSLECDLLQHPLKTEEEQLPELELDRESSPPPKRKCS